jgi:hypothetical protein
MEDSEGVYLYDRDGGLRYYVEDYTQLKKFNEEAVVIITKECIVFATEVKIEGQYIVSVVVDNKFESAFAHDNYVYVKRKYMMPVLDIYNNELVNVVRLYKNIKDQWAVLQTILSIPYGSLVPIGIKGNHLFCTKGKKLLQYNLDERKKIKITEDQLPNRTIETALTKMKEREVYR